MKTKRPDQHGLHVESSYARLTEYALLRSFKSDVSYDITMKPLCCLLPFARRRKARAFFVAGEILAASQVQKANLERDGCRGISSSLKFARPLYVRSFRKMAVLYFSTLCLKKARDSRVSSAATMAGEPGAAAQNIGCRITKQEENMDVTHYPWIC